MDFWDRMYILQAIAKGMKNIHIVPQNSLDPRENIEKFHCTVLASGDGFEPIESKVAKELGLELMIIKLPGETKKQYASSNY